MSATYALSRYGDPDFVARKLEGRGIRREVAGHKALLFARAAEALGIAGCDADRPAYGYWVPGRIEVLGKHTDYAGGRSLVVAADCGMAWLAVADAGKGDAVRVIDASQGEVAMLQRESAASDAPSWARYPLTVMRRFGQDFPGTCRAAALAFASDLPQAAGMSSSTAMVCGTGLTLAGVWGLEEHPHWREHLGDRLSLAQYLAAVESGQAFAGFGSQAGVGTRGGSEDHTAILCSQADHLGLYSYCPTKVEAIVEWPEEYVFVIGASGVKAEKTGAARERYNRAAALAREAAAVWRERTGRSEPHLAAIVRGGSENLERLRCLLTEVAGDEGRALRARLDHFVAESEEILPAASAALVETRLNDFAVQVQRSQKLAQELLGNQVPETMFLAQCAISIGALAASSFGAGFGGAVWAAVRSSEAGQFIEQWRKAYAGRFAGRAGQARFFATRAGSGAVRI